MFVLSWIKFFRGYVYVHLTGYATERFLNLCGSRNILIWNLKPTEDGYYFYISVDGYRSLKPILKKTKTKARILKKYGVPFQLFRYRKHKVFAAGIAVSAVLLFYCSGFVCWVFTNSGVHNLPRTTAQGIYNQCTPVSAADAKAGDIIFFTGTYNSGVPVSHVGIYCGNGVMIHCGDPISYASINSSYWQSHFYAFGRLSGN